MAIHDPVANMLTILRNGTQSKLAHVNVKRSKLNIAILEVLKKEKFIFTYKTMEDDKQGMLRVYLQVPESQAKENRVRGIREIHRVSKPGLRVYKATKEIPNVLRGLGTSVLSTSKGVMSGQEAKKQKIGGEILLKVW